MSDSHPRDQSLPAQPISTRKAQSRKKAHKPLRSLCISQKMCRPCLIIIKCDYFDYRINKLFTLSSCLVCVSCSVHDLISAYYVRKGSWPFFISITHKSTGSENPVTSSTLWMIVFAGMLFPDLLCFSLRLVPLRPFLHQIPGVQSHLLRSLEPRR